MARDPLDPMANAVYEAQDEVFGSEEADGLDGLQEFIDDVQGRNWFRSKYPSVDRMLVKDGRGAPYSRLGLDGNAHMRRDARYKHLTIHELSHKIDPTGAEDHGAIFCGIYLFLVGKVYSTNRKRRLAKAFRKWKAPWDKRVAATGRPLLEG